MTYGPPPQPPRPWTAPGTSPGTDRPKGFWLAATAMLLVSLLALVLGLVMTAGYVRNEVSGSDTGAGTGHTGRVAEYRG